MLVDVTALSKSPCNRCGYRDFILVEVRGVEPTVKSLASVVALVLVFFVV